MEHATQPNLSIFILNKQPGVQADLFQHGRLAGLQISCSQGNRRDVLPLERSYAEYAEQTNRVTSVESVDANVHLKPSTGRVFDWVKTRRFFYLANFYRDSSGRSGFCFGFLFWSQAHLLIGSFPLNVCAYR